MCIRDRLSTAKNKTRRHTLLKFYKVVAVTGFLYACETWAHTNKDYQGIQSAEMRLQRAVDYDRSYD